MDRPIRRAALFIYHRAPELCRPRVALLRMLNPGVPVHGLYAGPPASRESGAPDTWDLETWTSTDWGSPWERYANTDLLTREWFRATGLHHPFDVLHVVQWDLLLFAPLAAVFGHVAAGAVGVSGLTCLDRIRDRWSWAADPALRGSTEALLQFARASLGHRSPPPVCLGPGFVLPRTFIEQYAAMDVCESGHDEIRLPLYAQHLGFPLCDTGLYPAWYDAVVERTFNADDVEIAAEEVERHLQDPGGARAFHPCREAYDDERIAALVGRALGC